MTHRKLAVISKYIRVGDENTHANNSIGQLDLTSTTSIEPYPLVSSSRSWSPALVVLVCGWTRSIYLKSTFITTAAVARLLSSSVQQQKAHQSGPSSASVSSVRLVWSDLTVNFRWKWKADEDDNSCRTVLRILQIARLFAQEFHLLLQHPIHPGTIFYHHLLSLPDPSRVPETFSIRRRRRPTNGFVPWGCHRTTVFVAIHCDPNTYCWLSALGPLYSTLLSVRNQSASINGFFVTGNGGKLILNGSIIDAKMRIRTMMMMMITRKLSEWADEWTNKRNEEFKVQFRYMECIS